MYTSSTEEAIIMYMGNYCLIQEDELKSNGLELDFDINEPATIYFVCRRPRIQIDTNYYEILKKKIKLKFYAQKGNLFEPIFIEIPAKYDYEKLSIESKFPFNLFTIRDEFNNIFIHAKSGYFLDMFRSQIPKNNFLDLEVLYIGQSLDTSDNTPLKKRLLNHNKLQKINSEAIKNNPDKEIYLLLASFVQNNIIHAPSNVKLTKEDEEKDFQKLLHLIKNPSQFTLNQRTNFTEAALIKYFKPEYNEKFKFNFPDKTHNTYTECYELDINMVSVEVDTENIGHYLYSSHANKTYHHTARYHFHNSKDRRKMFEDLI